MVSDEFGHSVPRHVRQQVTIDASEDDPDAFAGKLFQQGANGLRRGQVDVSDRLCVDDEPLDRLRRLFDQFVDLIGKTVGVGVEEIRAEAIDDQSRRGLQARDGRRRLPCPPASGMSTIVCGW